MAGCDGNYLRWASGLQLSHRVASPAFWASGCVFGRCPGPKLSFLGVQLSCDAAGLGQHPLPSLQLHGVSVRRVQCFGRVGGSRASAHSIIAE